MGKMSLNEFVSKFMFGDFDGKSVDVQIDAGWYDWFCEDTSLPRKTQALGKKVLQLVKSDKLDRNGMYVFFKNNCTGVGTLYDDFRICDIKTGTVLYTVVPRSGHTGNAEVWSKENNFKEPVARGNWQDIKEFFGV